MNQPQLWLEMGGDFQLNNTGGLAWAFGWDVIRQNFERYIFTKPATNTVSGQPQAPDWIFSPNFGLGAGTMIGQSFGQNFVNTLQNRIYQGAMASASGNTNVPPVVTVTQGPTKEQINAKVIITPTGGQQQTLQVALP